MAVQLILVKKAGTGTGWDIENGSYASKSISIGAQEGTPGDLAFRPDGTRMFVIGSGNDDLFQYTLSTAWDVTTATYDSVSFNIGVPDPSPMGIYFRSDGLKFYTAGATFSKISEWDMSSAWDTSTASYTGNDLTVSGQTTALNDVSFSSDGTTMYVVGDSNNSVFQYTLSTPWDLSTASYASKSFNFGTAQDTNPHGIVFKDSTTMFMVGASTDAVYQYTLGTAWDISTLSYDSITLSVAGQTTGPRDLAFSANGKNMYVIGTPAHIYQYDT